MVFRCINLVSPSTTTPTTTVKMPTLIINSIKVKPCSRPRLLVQPISFLIASLSASANRTQCDRNGIVKAIAGGPPLPRRSRDEPRAVCSHGHHVPAHVIRGLRAVRAAVHVLHGKARWNSTERLSEVNAAIVDTAGAGRQRRALPAGSGGSLRGRTRPAIAGAIGQNDRRARGIGVLR